MSNLGPESRALLEEGREALRPASGDRERILAALRARTGAANPDLAGQVASPAATSGLGWPVISTIVVGLAFGGGLFLHQLSTEELSAAPPAASVLPVVAPPEVAEPAPTVEPTTVMPVPAPQPGPAAERSSVVARPQDKLAEEVALLSRAEKELHAGRFAPALALLGEHQRRFPRGTLAQERIAARIQALCGLGRVREANAELGRVAPDSLHAGRVREACAKSR